MNSGATGERVYDALKRRIATHALRPGERLDPARLGEDLHSSATPVRDALHILVGEGLVETRPSDGFHVAPIDAPALQDLYDWNAELLLLAIRGWSRKEAPSAPAEDSPPVAVPAAADVFARIAGRSRNAEHARAVRAANDHLGAARQVELSILAGIDAELAEIVATFARGDIPSLRRRILAYHRRRRRAAPEIVRALYRPA